MASAGSIFVDLLLNDGKYIQGLNRSRQATSQAASAWQRDVNKTRDSFSSVISPIDNITSAVKNLGGVFAGALSVQQIIRYSDTFKGLESRLGLVTGSASQLANVQAKLFDISQNTAQPLAATVDAYTRLSGSLNATQKGQTDLIRLTELLSKTLLISGADATGAATFYQQFGQAASSDFKAIGQELGTFADQNPRFYAILKKEADTYGKTLKNMAQNGELSFDFISKALIKSGSEIDEQAAGIALTVGKSFTKLDNAFLNYIGKTDAIKQGTSTIALGISGLADNINLVADGAIVLSTIFLARLIPAVTATATEFLAMSASSLGLQLALGRMEGVSTAAAGGLLGLSAAGRAASAGMALLGGPIGIAVIAAVTAFTLHTNQAIEAQGTYDKIIGDVTKSYANYSTASDEVRAKIQQDSEARAGFIRHEREELEKLVTGYASINENSFTGVGNQFLLGAKDLLGKMGIGQAPSEMIAKYEAAQKALEDLQKQRDAAGAGKTPVGPDYSAMLAKYDSYINGYTKKSKEFEDKQKDLKTLFDAGKLSSEDYSKAIANLNKEYSNESGYKTSKKSLEEINSLYEKNRIYTSGLSQETIQYNDTVKELSQELAAGKITQDQYSASLVKAKDEIYGLNSLYKENETYITGLSKEYLSYRDSLDEVAKLYDNGRISADQYYTALANIDKGYDESAKKASAWSFDIKEAGKEASRNIQDSFAEFLFDPFAAGMDGMLTGFLTTIRKMASEALSAKILSGLFGDDGIDVGKIAKSSTGFLKSAAGFVSGLFDGFHADGGFIKPGHFGVAGEAGAELIFGGNTGASVIPMNKVGSGSGSMTVNIINNAGVQVAQNQRSTANGMELDVMIDQAVATKIGTPGSRTNQALSAFNNRGLVRR